MEFNYKNNIHFKSLRIEIQGCFPWRKKSNISQYESTQK